MTGFQFNGYETEKLFLCLAASVLNGEQAPQLPDDADIEELIDVAKRQKMSPLLYCALNGMSEPPTGEAWKKLQTSFLSDCMRSEIQMEEYHKLVSFLCSRGVKLLPLKGCVLKELYPFPYLRVMSDVDMLYSGVSAKQLSVLMKEFGYSVDTLGRCSHDVYYKRPVMNVELHRALAAKNSPYLPVLRGLFDKAVPDEQTENLFHMRPEDMYIHILAHSVKHFKMSGLNMRNLCDVYVMNRIFAASWDGEYIFSQLASVGLDRFERKLRGMADTLFGVGDEKISEDDIAVLFSISSADRSWNYMANGGKSRFGYLLYKLFKPYDEMCALYPVLIKAPVLLPAFWIYRYFDELVLRKKSLVSEIKAVTKVDTENAAYAAQIMHDFGLE